MLPVDGMPLAEFLAELRRYRTGWIDCAPEVASLPISGAFPLADTDRVLAAVADTLPLRLRYRTRYWVSVLPREGADASFL
jgi:transmembrane sensor